MQPSKCGLLGEKEEVTTFPELLGSGERVRDTIGGDLLFVAESRAMRTIRSQAERLARVDVPLLILGESGTGKEVLARAVHQLSDRCHQPFVKVNCAALPAGLLESELFGYEAGAFTGATRKKPGKFELCGRGTILLDEIGEIPPELQAKLLQVVQDQKYYRLGGNVLVEVKARILAATNVDIKEAMLAGRFRQDLYYRLSAFTLQLPPLRTRQEDIPTLLHHFMQKFAKQLACAPLPISAELLDACKIHTWPGNLRELENLIKRFLVMRDEKAQLEQLLEKAREVQASRTPAVGMPAAGLRSHLRAQKATIEREEISRVLKMTGYNRAQAARVLKISYKSLRTKAQEYGLVNPSLAAAREAFGASPAIP